MSLDHYVSQVHLKKFYSPRLGSLMYAIRKSDLKAFTPDAQSVCRIEDGSTNMYLREDRTIEEFLKKIEPRYNDAIVKLSTNNIDSEAIYTIAGFISYVLTCSPAGMRIQSGPLKAAVETTAIILDKKGAFSKPPPVLGSESLTDLLNSGDVHAKVDPKYPQAIGIALILKFIIMFGNFTWDILINSFEDSPFFTSDFPIAIEKPTDIRILNRIIPLSPNLAIRIRPDLSFDKEHSNYSFSNFRHTIQKISRAEVIRINRLIVRCAESTIFYRDDYDWISKFVNKNANFRIEPKTLRIPQNNGYSLLFTQEVVDTTNINTDSSISSPPITS